MSKITKKMILKHTKAWIWQELPLKNSLRMPSRTFALSVRRPYTSESSFAVFMSLFNELRFCSQGFKNCVNIYFHWCHGLYIAMIFRKRRAFCPFWATCMKNLRIVWYIDWNHKFYKCKLSLEIACVMRCFEFTCKHLNILFIKIHAESMALMTTLLTLLVMH